MKRFDSNLKEYSRGKYILYKDHEAEIAALKKQIKKLREEYKIATTTESYVHYFNNRDSYYNDCW